MLSNKLLGLPLIVWAVLCLAMAVVWAFVWPSGKIAAHEGARFLILRWGHALAWLLLAAAALVAALGGQAGVGPALWLARAAGLAYFIFIAAVATS